MLVAAGCAPAVRVVPRWSYGPYPVTPALLPAIAEAMRSAGLSPTIDAARGEVRAEARPCERGAAPTFVVRAYREGWVELTAENRGVARGRRRRDARCVTSVPGGYRMVGRSGGDLTRLALALQGTLEARFASEVPR